MQKSKWLPIVTAFFLCFAACSMLNEALAAYVVHGKLQEPHLPQRTVQVLQLQGVHGGVPIGGRG